MVAKTRKKLTATVEVEVFRRSGRRCCICVALHGDCEVTAGQIAHLDRDSSNNDPDNLCFLCLRHHDEYDTRTSQSKGFTEAEVRAYREQLDEKLPSIISLLTAITNPVTHSAKSPVDSELYAELWEQLFQLRRALGQTVALLGFSNDVRHSNLLIEYFNSFNTKVHVTEPFMDAAMASLCKRAASLARTVIMNKGREERVNQRRENADIATDEKLANDLLSLDDQNQDAFEQFEELYEEIKASIRKC